MKKKILKNFIIVCIWIGIWELVARATDNSIVLAGPWDTCKALWAMLQEKTTYDSILASLARILGGVACGWILGTFLSVLASKIHLVEDFLRPFVQLVKSIPVASFVIILLIWAGSKNLAFYISLLVAFPVTYLNLLNALKSVNQKEKETARVFQMSAKQKLKFIYLPHLKPAITTALELGVGMGFKSGVAAEVIGQPLSTIGNEMYQSKIYLDTDRLFAWTFIVIVLSIIVEKILKAIVRKVIRDK